MTSPYRIQPEHVVWIQQQLESRHVRLEQGAILSIMTDFWNKNGSRLVSRNIQESAAVQILNNKLLTVLLSRFKPSEVNAVTSNVAHMESRPKLNKEGNPNQTKEWVDRPAMGSIRAMNHSDMEQKMGQFDLDRDSLFPKPKTVQFADPEPTEPLAHADNLYEQILILREKQATEMGLSATSPAISEQELKHMTHTTFAPASVSVIPGTPEFELRVANTLPKPILKESIGKRPIPRNVPSTPEILIPPLITNSSFTPTKITPPDNGSLLPMEMEKQVQLPSREEFMKMASAQQTIQTSGPIYDATGVFREIANRPSTQSISDPLGMNSSQSILASIPKSNIQEPFYVPPIPAQIKEISTPILPTYFPDYQTFHWYLTVDSINRDLEIYPLPTYFQVRFEEPSTSLETPSRLGSRGEIIYEPTVKYQYTGGFGAKMERIYENIVSIACPHAVLPLERPPIYGKPVYSFNGPMIDQNKVLGSDHFTSHPFGSIFKTDYGIPQSICSEPYLCLHVEEIDGLYDGTNKTIRNSLATLMYNDNNTTGNFCRPYIHFTTTMDEKKVYIPTALGKLSQMTLRLLTRTNQLVPMGIDKTYIESITQGDLIPDTVCDVPPGNHLTKITITTSHTQYNCNTPLCGADVSPGNLLYFFTMFSCNPQTDRIPLNSNIILNLSNYPTATFSTKINIQSFLQIGDILFVNEIYYFDILSISDFECIVQLRGSFVIPSTIVITSVSYIKKSKRGFQSEEVQQFNRQNGLYVVKGDDADSTSFQVSFPYEYLPDYLKSDTNGTYVANDAFFIRQNKQIVYSFEVVVLQPRTDQLTSRIITDGGRPM